MDEVILWGREGIKAEKHLGERKRETERSKGNCFYNLM